MVTIKAQTFGIMYPSTTTCVPNAAFCIELVYLILVSQLEPGEPGGKLYGIWSTSLPQLGDFGLGVGLYFYMTLMVTVLLAVAGLMNAYTIHYFKSDNYNPDGQVVPNVFLEGRYAIQPEAVQLRYVYHPLHSKYLLFNGTGSLFTVNSF